MPRHPCREHRPELPVSDSAKGIPVDIGGYHYPYAEKTAAVMRPSETFDEALKNAQSCLGYEESLPRGCNSTLHAYQQYLC